jgi:hypothetical protein
MKNILLLLSTLIPLAISPAVYAIDYVKDSYTVTFKPNTSVIDPPNEANRGKVPFGEHSSGQSKEELAIQLGIVGEVIYIYDLFNAANIKMSAEQAYILSLDERVLRVEQDKVGTLFVQNPEDLDKVEEIPIGNPTYQDGIITIPIIDTPEQTGTFQDVTLQLTEQGECYVQDFKAIGSFPLTRPYVETVELIVTESFPIQVFLKVNGLLSDGCMAMGKISQRLTKNQFEVIMFAENTVDLSTHACTMDVTYFEKTIPLPVYGLSTGTYEYSLGNVLTLSTRPASEKTFTGTFELTQDNILSDD